MIKTLLTTLKQDKETFEVPKSVQDAIPIRPEAADGDGILHGLGEDEALPILLQRIL